MRRSRLFTVSLRALALGAFAIASHAARAATPTASISLPTSGAMLARLNQPISCEFKAHRFEDVLAYLSELTGVAIQPLWADDAHAIGLSRDKPITARFDRTPAIRVIDRLLESLQADSPRESCTWQIRDGVLEVGPRARLNARKNLVLYDINDLLHIVPDFTDAPRVDIQSALQSGAASIPFQQTGGSSEGSGLGGVTPKSRDDRAADLARLIVDLIETEQWEDNGGDGGSIRIYRGSLLINAPEYIHRQLSGVASGSR